MPKVMILDNELCDVLAFEKALKTAGYEVCIMTGPYGILAKFEFEKPDILLFNPDMPGADTDALIETLLSTPSMQGMGIILICGDGDPELVQQYCCRMNLNGYYMKAVGYEGIVSYLAQFYAEC